MASHSTQAQLQELARYSGDPWSPENSYFTDAESKEADFGRLWDLRIWPVIKDCDFSNVIDLAAGHGRNSVRLLPLVNQLTIVDIQPGNIDACRKRFGNPGNINYMVNNGYDLAGIPDKSITLVYCFDAMVHFDSDVVRSYLREIFRVLRPGGKAFLHHSNYNGGHDWKTNPAARNFMTAELFVHYALKESLQPIHQQIIDWGAHKAMDCLALLKS